MAEVPFTNGTLNFYTAHAETGVYDFDDFRFIETGIEAGPTATGVKLRFGRKKFRAATLANVNTGFPKLIVLADIRPLGILFPEHGVFFRCQFLFPLFFCLGEAHNFKGYGGWG